jgi:hypothetical protein
MPLPSWAKNEILGALEAIPEVQYGEACLQVRLNYFGGGLASVKVKVSGEDEIRDPSKK